MRNYINIKSYLLAVMLMLTAGHSKVVPISKIKETMTAIPSVTELTEKDMNDAAKTFGFDAGLVDEGIYYSVDDIMNVNELLIVRVEDDDNREIVADAVNQYLKEKTDSFDGYGTNQFGLLSSAVTTGKGTYYFFGVSEDVLRWESDFLKCIR